MAIRVELGVDGGQYGLESIKPDENTFVKHVKDTPSWLQSLCSISDSMSQLHLRWNDYGHTSTRDYKRDRTTAPAACGIEINCKSVQASLNTTDTDIICTCLVLEYPWHRSPQYLTQLPPHNFTQVVRSTT